MNKCVVYACSNNRQNPDPTVQYHPFPTNKSISQVWLDFCSTWETKDIDINSAQICSKHFDVDSYKAEYKMDNYLNTFTKVLKHDAIPTLHSIRDETMSALKSQSAHVQGQCLYDETKVREQICQSVYTTSDLCVDNVNLSLIKLDDSSMILTDDTKLLRIDNGNGCDQNMQHVVENVKAMNKKNELLTQEVSLLEQNLREIKKNLYSKMNLLRRKRVERNRLLENLHHLEMKSLSFNEQKKILSSVFSESQIKILTGKKKIYWSNDDMAVGHTIRHMSSKRCYMYLAKNLNIPLPALSSIKRWQTLKKEEYDKIKDVQNVENEESDV